ncbi:DNA primase [Halocella sp. SP3-1]|uniref:DNA primase n=1 Tax=Halocella sp. SP3-1 TaxID=2382161 RepID=UPI000F7575A1|nr:DNA primase [Halocella sp. SP3-1]AZO95029.1 DNA primase [Halocella sp. SP3-1]
MPGINDSFIEKLKDRANIVELVSDYLSLKKAGKNYKGLCPFHQEKTPSFNVDPEKQLYYCFGCGAGGDIISFLMEIENTTFIEAVKVIARRVGLAIPEENPYEQQQTKARDRVFTINNLTARFYNYLLLNDQAGKNALAYLYKRGFQEEDIKKYQLGYAPDSWHALLKFLASKGYQQEELHQIGLISKSKGNYFDKFRNRVIFPIFNVRGEVLAFGARVIDSADSSKPKYLNSPETLIYKKGENIYGLNWAKNSIRSNNYSIIMEGYTDVLTAHQYGIDNAVASLGTALTTEQARLLKRYASTVYIAYDADAAGARATMRGLDILKSNGLKVRIVSLPEDMDPDEYIKKEGGDAFRNFLKESLPLIDFKIKELVKNRDFSQVEERIDLTRKLIYLLINIDDNIERQVYADKIAERFAIDRALIKKELNKGLQEKDTKKKDKNYKNRYTKKDNETNTPNNINRIETIIIKQLIDRPDIREKVLRYLETDFFSRNNRNIIEYICENPRFDVKEDINKLQDKELKKRMLAFAVANNNSNIINKFGVIFSKFILEVKKRLYARLQNSDNIELDELNILLLNFKKLSAYNRKEGF